MTRTVLSAAFAVVAFTFALPAVASADTSFTSGDTTSLITADAGGLVYTTPGRSTIRLRQGFGPAAKNLPLRGERFGPDGFWGVDLGTDSEGGRALTYSRCKRDACDLYAYGFASKKERKLKSLSRSACLERNPSMVRGAVVFVRRARTSRKPRLRCAGGIFRKRPGKKLERIAKDEPFAIDYDGRQVVYKLDQGTKGQIRVFRPGQKSKLLAQGIGESDRGGNRGTFLDYPTLADGKAYWVRSAAQGDGGTTFTDVVRRSADASGAAQVLDRPGRLWVDNSAQHSDGAMGGVAVDGDKLYYAYGNARIGLVSGSPVFR